MCHEFSGQIKGVPLNTGFAREIAPLICGQNVNEKISEVSQQLFRFREVQHRRLAIVGRRKRENESSEGNGTRDFAVRLHGNEPALRATRVALIISVIKIIMT